VRSDLWLFAPNRDNQGGSAWFLEHSDRDLLIDVPALTEANLAFLQHRSRPGQIVLTGRDGHGRCRALQEALGWPVLVQEQEAFLLPGVKALETFGLEHALAPGLRLLWTPGPSPGACVLHAFGADAGGSDDGGGLFCGRLLVPVAPGRLEPRRSRRTFHWPRQIASLRALRAWLPAGTPGWIASGAGLGALRGESLVGSGEALLADLEKQAEMLLAQGIDPL
jgi:glyoxylase-like metal-dependent hydrolase (beta-lactamase superfamily II)